MTISSTDVQPLKLLLPISTSDSGRVTLLSAVQPLNTLVSSSVMPSPMTTVSKEVQFMNASS